MSNIARNAESEANAYIFLCSQNDQGGYAGYARGSATCSNDKSERLSISEYLHNDVYTAAVKV